MRRFCLCAILVLALPARADDGKKTFKDWEAFNRLDGTSWLRSLAPGKTPEGGTPSGIDLLRRSDELAPYSLVLVSTRAIDPARPVTLVLDGERIPVKAGALLARDVPEALAVQDQAALDKIAAKLKNSHALSVEAQESDSKPVKFEVNLAGLAASMLWLDDQQGKVGKPFLLRPLDVSVNATRQEDIGYKVSVAIPTGKDAPKGWRDVPQVLLEKHVARGGCDVVRPGFDNTSSEAQRMDPVITVYAISCTAGAYNFGSRYWSVRSGDFLGAEVLMFADSDGAGGFTGTDILINPALDAQKGEITSFAKGRGIGDCGSAGKWKWDGYRFVLQELRAQDACNGVDSEHWPVVFRAKRK